jgi:membrane-bound ClpP family serine protease
METSQPQWPPRTFEKIFTPILVLVGLLLLAFLFSGISLLIMVCVVALIIGLIWIVMAVLRLAAKSLWHTFFGR